MRQRIDRLILLCTLYFVFCTPNVFAWDYATQEKVTTHSMQIRVGAEATKKWDNGLRLHFAEDLRSDVYNSENGAAFKNSYTTLSLTYHPIEYVKIDAGYTLKINAPHSSWKAEKKADPNEWIRHRVFASVTGSYSTRYLKLSLRERVLMEARTDSIGVLPTDSTLMEKNRYNWQLRSKLAAEFYVPGKPVKPYLWIELINTLNAPELQQKNGHQYISTVRTQAGVKWRLTRLSSLDFYYRFTYGYDRDINITKKNSYIELTEEYLFQHAIGVIYCIDW